MKDWAKVMIFIQTAYSTESPETLLFLVQMFNAVYGYDKEAVATLESFTSREHVAERLREAMLKKQ